MHPHLPLLSLFHPSRKLKHEISIIVDRVILNSSLGNRLADSVETAVNLSNGLLVVELGEDSIKSGTISLIVGFTLVIIYMIIKYRFFGFIFIFFPM